MMNIQNKVLTVVVFLMLVASVHAVDIYDEVVIGDWELVTDGWVDRATGLNIDDPSLSSKYGYDTIGATLGSNSIRVTQLGQLATLKLQLTPDQKLDFLASNTFSIDMSVAADTLGVGGFAKIVNLVINNGGTGPGWTTLPWGTNLSFWPGSGERTETFEIDYSSIKASIDPDSYIQIILVTNGSRATLPDATAADFYFDNARFYSTVGIGDWEGTPDNCIDWVNKYSIDDPNNMPSKYTYESSIGVTKGTQSLHLSQDGTGQNLTFILDAAQRADFMANHVFAIDVTVPEDTTGVDGYTRIYNVAISAQDYGYNSLFDPPALILTGAALAGEETETLIVDYEDAKGLMPASPSYVQIVISTQNDENAPGARDDYYFDNARLFGGLSGGCELLLADINGDCIVDYYDFAQIGVSWMLCNDPAGCP
ncbi:MAG: hypothetical protein KAJ07_06735 [Planctomycetes bacterium]|nr:hypothetical protein [Planctomycetota bacterium]